MRLLKYLPLAAVAALAVTAGGAYAAHAGSSSRAQHSTRSRANGSRVGATLKHGLLKVDGTNAADKIALRLQAGNPGVIQVDAGDDATADFSFPRASVARIKIDAGNGDDLVRIDDVNGAFTTTIPTTIDGANGNDTLTGGAGAEKFQGGNGDDTINGKGGSDTAFLGNGDDTFVWNPGDGSDTLAGQGGDDTLLFNGANVAEQIDISAFATTNGNGFRFVRDIANITMIGTGIEQVDFNALGGVDVVTAHDLSRTGVEKLNLDLGVNGAGDGSADNVNLEGTGADDAIDVAGSAGSVTVSGLAELVSIHHAETADGLSVAGLGGNDTMSATGLAAQTVGLTLDGGSGDDRLAGGPGVEKLLGGDGNDSVDGDGGNDLAFLGNGDDTFVWDPGDGSDTVEGQAGNDTMVFNGANVAEHIDLSANGNRLRFFRDIGNITMDTAGVEQVDINALDGADTVTTNDLTGTDVNNVNVDLGASDGKADSVIVNGTPGTDLVTAAGSAGSATVTGLAATVTTSHAEPAVDTLAINTLGGGDQVTASALDATAIKLTLDGGADADTLIGGSGNDVIVGGRGNDLALLGAGDDTFVWNPGDGSDTVEGQDGNDTMVFNGANVAEHIDLSANGNRLRFFRDIANITMDTAGVEQVDFNALGGADTISVHDLAGTDVNKVNLDLGVNGAGDGSADNVLVDGTENNDVINVSGGAGSVNVSGLAAAVAVTHAEPANDGLTVNALGGDDVVTASALDTTSVKLTVHGGDGADVITGSVGDDALFGDAGDDILIGGPGLDLLDGGPGNNILIQ
jgi:Ca2+-binding RTX toxin-like protein